MNAMRTFLQLHQKLYIASGGAIGHRVPGMPPSLLLTSVGAKTGARRVNSLTYARDGDRFIVVASNGGARRNPAWLHNLKAHPDTSVQVGRRTVDVHASALDPADADYARLWKIADDNNSGRYAAYQRKTQRQIPVVVLAPR